MIGETNNSGPGRGIQCPIFSPLVKSTYSKLFSLFLSQSICCGYSKEPFPWDGSFQHPKHVKIGGLEKKLQFYTQNCIFSIFAYP